MLTSVWENGNCDLHCICILTGQCTCTVLQGSLTVLKLCKATVCVCACMRVCTPRHDGYAPAGLLMNN